MAQPRSYIPAKEFADHTETQPSDPQVGSDLDVEFSAIKLTLGDVLANLAKIQRDDLVLANKAVTSESFRADALALITTGSLVARGDWAASVEYIVGDLAYDNAATYLCQESHTSSSTFAANSGKFILLANDAILSEASSVDRFSGDGSTKVFSLSSNTPSGSADVLVFVNGSHQNPSTTESSADGDYKIDSSATPPNLEFETTAPSTGTDNIIVWGASSSVESARTASVAAQAAAEAAEVDSEDSNLESEQWATKLDAVVNTFTSGSENSDGTLYSSKELATGDANSGALSTGGSSKNWAQQLPASTSDDVDGASTNDRSAKAWSQGANMTGATHQGSAKDWAQVTGGTVDGTLFSSKEHATGTTAESAKSWATKIAGDVPGGTSGDKSAKSWASETGVNAPSDGSSKEWAVSTSVVDGTLKGAKGYADDAATTFTDFGTKYLGAKSSDPEKDNDDNDLIGGALYFNTGADNMRVYDLSAETWIVVAAVSLPQGLATSDSPEFTAVTVGSVPLTTTGKAIAMALVFG